MKFIPAALVALVISSHATAATFDAPLSKRVQFADLDLAHDAGVERLYRRIRSAAQWVCEGLKQGRFVTTKYRQCRDQAIDRAIIQVNHPRLTAYAAQRRLKEAHRAG